MPSLTHDGKEITSEPAKASLFNDYFVSIFTKEDLSNLDKVKQHLPASCFDFGHLSVSPAEVFEELSNLNIHKACGSDQICPCLLKESADVFAPSLADLFNKSLCDGVLPQDWVSANVTPVYKKSSKQHVANYRPFSLTSIVCKVLEKLTHHKLYRLLESNHVLCDSQFGFRANQSTTSLLLATTHDWAKTLEDRQSSHCVFTDYAKAFDSVPRKIAVETGSLWSPWTIVAVVSFIPYNT